VPATALVFPGQASQRPGAGRPFLGTPHWSLVAELSDAAGRDVAHLLLDADAEELRATDAAQLSVFAASLLALQLVDVEPVVVAGHSLGEYTALVAAGVLTVAEGARLVAERGAAMRAAADAAPGTMAAVLGLDPEAVASACATVDGCWPANDNAPLHVVVSGTVDGVAAATPVLKEAGARRVLPLEVGGAFHTPLMAPARPRLEAALDAAAYQEARVPVLSNVTARPHDGAFATRLSEQLTAPVRWRESVAALDVDEVVEVGPGGVLTGLVKRIRPDLATRSVSTPEEPS
jgi:[acyl-carrier-protein] S-malonyltransferase